MVPSPRGRSALPDPAMRALDALSCQLYSAREHYALEELFALLAGIGYRKVEPYGALFPEAPRLKKLLDRHGMTAPSIHVGLDHLRADAKDAAARCRDLGVETLFVPAPPPGEREKDEAGWRALGRELRSLGESVAAAGLKFGWHNHAWEYEKTADGRIMLDLIFEEAPDLLWQADLAWIVRGGGDPVAELKRHAGRVAACHVKDLAPAGDALDEGGWADPGHGVMDWPALLSAMRAAGVSLYVVEHDRPSDPARFARRAYETVAGWG